MSNIFSLLSFADVVALSFFLFSWLAFEFLNDYSSFSKYGTDGLMAEKRREWMLVLAERDLRMVDTSIMAGLMQGTAFFASASILAIGGCFALLGSIDDIIKIYNDLPVAREMNRELLEIKVLGLTSIFVYTFFKFGWCFRLFNYCSILIGAVPQCDKADLETRQKKALIAAEMNITAGKHFTAGLRGIFQALAFLGWFIGPGAFLISTILVLLVLIRRQYFSRARAILID